MVAEATKSPASPVYELRSFHSRDSVGALIGRARKALVREFDREIAPLGLTTVQALVLILLADGVTVTAAGLCRELSHDAGALTRIVDKLEAGGLVRRVRRERDRRATDLELTKEGRRVHAEVKRVQVEVLNRMLRGFSRAEARALESLLKRLIENGGQ
jgi:DNA-binding MarR family transcriptional regulator